MIDPASTVLVAALYAPIALTSLRKWGPTGLTGPSVSQIHSTDLDVSEQRVETEELVGRDLPVTVDRVSAVVLELEGYRSFVDGWDGEHSLGPTSESLDAAKLFVQQLPPGLPVPVPMISPTGEVGVYWDEQGGYADMSFDAQGGGSFFSRAADGAETFVDDLNVSELDRAWYFAAVGQISAPVSLVA